MSVFHMVYGFFLVVEPSYCLNDSTVGSVVSERHGAKCSEFDSRIKVHIDVMNIYVCLEFA